MQSKSRNFFITLCGVLTLMTAIRAAAASEKPSPFFRAPW